MEKLHGYTKEEKTRKAVTGILKDAQARIKKGWCQCYRMRYNPKTGVFDHCSTGAIESLGFTRKHTDAAFRLLGDTIRDHGDPECSSIVPWNDAPGRTQAEVVAMFDKAIENSEVGGGRK